MNACDSSSFVGISLVRHLTISHVLTPIIINAFFHNKFNLVKLYYNF